MEKSIQAIRFTGLDMINQANSGHPGIVLGAAPILYRLYTKHLKVMPSDPKWFNRDRFVMSAGHGSALLYATLHYAGYDISMHDLKDFRQLKSLTPGHPEYRHTPGVDATTGPLGQGISMAVGMAIAESYLRHTFNKSKFSLIDHHTYVLCGDGDLQEGVTFEAMSLAGHLELEKLIVLYDSNDVQLDGPTKAATSTDIKQWVKSLKWDYQLIEDANDLEAIDEAIAHAKHASQPSFIEIKSVIGYGSTKAGTAATHGAPLGVEETTRMREAMDYPHPPFEPPKSVYTDFFEQLTIRVEKDHIEWQESMEEFAQLYPKLFEQLEDIINRQVHADLEQLLELEPLGTKEATRVTGGKIIDVLSHAIPGMIGGSADLSVSTKVKGIHGDFSKQNRIGRNIQFGVREHGMGAIINGLSLHHLKAFSGGFLIFSDYMKPAIRLAALMEIPSIFVFTHDSVAVGEDGPTHQPIEQLSMLRTIPHLVTLRPAHANETKHAFRYAIEAIKTPTVIALTRQDTVVNSDVSYEAFKKGAYIVYDHADAEGILIATGSELNIALGAQKILSETHQIEVRVVSMPSLELFKRQNSKTKNSILSPELKKRLVIEAGSPDLWYQIAPHVHGIEHFGASAKGAQVLDALGMSEEAVVKHYLSIES